MSCACGNNPEKPMTDEEKQSFINEQFEEGVFLSDVIDYVAFELSGIVKQISLKEVTCMFHTR